mmetsp:Transcript_51166/g.111052  ORF Transcript_51166/g.111052 Transcript_51166/m.111052 type:complete len:301 (-) Transcript_51166:164-1066(-)
MKAEEGTASAGTTGLAEPGTTSTEPTQSRRLTVIPTKVGDALSVLDVDFDGNITLQELRRHIRHVHVMRKLALMLFVVLIVLAVGMFAVAYAALETAKELRAKKGLLVDSTGEAVAVSESVTNLGALIANGRRLQIAGEHIFEALPEFSLCNESYYDYTEKGKIKFVLGKDFSKEERDQVKEAGGSADVEAAFTDGVRFRVSGRSGSCMGPHFFRVYFEGKRCLVRAWLAYDQGRDKDLEKKTKGRRLPESEDPADFDAISELISRAHGRFDKKYAAPLDRSLQGDRELGLLPKCAARSS